MEILLMNETQRLCDANICQQSQRNSNVDRGGCRFPTNGNWQQNYAKLLRITDNIFTADKRKEKYSNNIRKIERTTERGSSQTDFFLLSVSLSLSLAFFSVCCVADGIRILMIPIKHGASFSQHIVAVATSIVCHPYPRSRSR